MSSNKIVPAPWVLSVVFATVATLLPQRTAAQPWSTDPESLKRTDRLIEKAQDLIKQVGATKQEIEKTLASYNALFKEGVPDVRTAYKDVEKGIERSEKQREEARKRLDVLKTEADAYFAGWTASLQGITSEDLRKRSEARMSETRGRFDQILGAGREAREEYEPFIASLRDQWTYLGHDLNPSGIASLKPDADKLNARATELFKKIDASTTKANEYIVSLRSAKPVSEN